jgi:hypothetical protein
MVTGSGGSGCRSLLKRELQAVPAIATGYGTRLGIMVAMDSLGAFQRRFRVNHPQPIPWLALILFDFAGRPLD